MIVPVIKIIPHGTTRCDIEVVSDPIKKITILVSNDERHTHATFEMLLRVFQIHHGQEMRMGMVEDCSALNFVFINDTYLDDFQSDDSELRRLFDKVYSRSCDFNSKDETDAAIMEINRDLADLEYGNMRIKTDGKKIIHQDYASINDATVMLFGLITLCRMLAPYQAPIILDGKWFERLDRKLRYRLCSFFIIHFSQTVIFTSKELLDVPIGHDCPFTLYDTLVDEGTLSRVYELDKDGAKEYFSEPKDYFS